MSLFGWDCSDCDTFREREVFCLKASANTENENQTEKKEEKAVPKVAKAAEPLKQRIMNGADSSDKGSKAKKEQEKTASKSPQKKKIKKVAKDPLHWFGILVPESLRTSQGHFKHGNLSSDFFAIDTDSLSTSQDHQDCKSHLSDQLTTRPSQQTPCRPRHIYIEPHILKTTSFYNPRWWKCSIAPFNSSRSMDCVHIDNLLFSFPAK